MGAFGRRVSAGNRALSCVLPAKQWTLLDVILSLPGIALDVIHTPDLHVIRYGTIVGWFVEKIRMYQEICVYLFLSVFSRVLENI